MIINCYLQRISVNKISLIKNIQSIYRRTYYTNKQKSSIDDLEEQILMNY